jgi:hypothetical protein
LYSIETEADRRLLIRTDADLVIPGRFLQLERSLGRALSPDLSDCLLIRSAKAGTDLLQRSFESPHLLGNRLYPIESEADRRLLIRTAAKLVIRERFLQRNRSLG